MTTITAPEATTALSIGTVTDPIALHIPYAENLVPALVKATGGIMSLRYTTNGDSFQNWGHAPAQGEDLHGLLVVERDHAMLGLLILTGALAGTPHEDLFPAITEITDWSATVQA